ncbi:MAG TPA: rhomboid family intramembrane serine protease [Paludibacteraceae bacterium]|mgnify:CR=1 FL=1|jgi:membrane associated rhomboid family serine protease|nr:rhomboid family intramembrane serine protease [Paludibacteraceae bacterium]OPZ02319.1 MAG: Rhomboid family protein [Bacteroidetes bacterium ADurb.BinA395]MBP8966717.1 rhomboid family intramembrane serine protease [Paludibacteraceae bacterium]HOF98657.1 rhomboid family intramembrane serine protease [Paludibacteraceae bacterium]HOJ65883.1 rhomboid family intramembrane serine protease [Paludibacteraceae bacterium]
MSYRSSFFGSIPVVVKNLILINIILWLATLVLPRFFLRWGINVDLVNILGMHYWGSKQFNPAQLITYMFLHGNFEHIFFNMFALFMFGTVLEQFWGPKRFMLYYMVTGIGAALIQQLFWSVEYQPVISALNEAINTGNKDALFSHEGVLSRFFRINNLAALDTTSLIELKHLFVNLPVTIGASGAIFGLLLAFGWLFPDAKLMLIFLPIPIRARIFVLMYAVAELFLGVAGFTGDNVAHFAHLGGMLFGIFLILYWKKKGVH